MPGVPGIYFVILYCSSWRKLVFFCLEIYWMSPRMCAYLNIIRGLYSGLVISSWILICLICSNIHVRLRHSAFTLISSFNFLNSSIATFGWIVLIIFAWYIFYFNVRNCWVLWLLLLLLLLAWSGENFPIGYIYCMYVTNCLICCWFWFWLLITCESKYWRL